MSFLRNDPSREERGRTAVFAGDEIPHGNLYRAQLRWCQCITHMLMLEKLSPFPSFTAPAQSNYLYWLATS